MPALIAAAGERAARRFLEFFAANISNQIRRLTATMGPAAIAKQPGVARTIYRLLDATNTRPHQQH